MKTVTMDYETYREEMLAERLRGTKIRRSLLEAIEGLIEGLNSHDGAKYKDAERCIYQACAELRQICAEEKS